MLFGSAEMTVTYVIAFTMIFLCGLAFLGLASFLRRIGNMGL